MFTVKDILKGSCYFVFACFVVIYINPEFRMKGAWSFDTANFMFLFLFVPGLKQVVLIYLVSK